MYRDVGCKGLALTEVMPGEGFGEGSFVRADERVYTRIGVASYESSRRDLLPMALGECPLASDMAGVTDPFIRNENSNINCSLSWSAPPWSGIHQFSCGPLIVSSPGSSSPSRNHKPLQDSLRGRSSSRPRVPFLG